MSDIEINVAIAEVMGHKYHKPMDKEVKGGSYYQYEPNFLHDLNACVEFEKSMTDDEYVAYRELMGTKYGFRVLSAPSAGRCEMFLRVKGLWKK